MSWPSFWMNRPLPTRLLVPLSAIVCWVAQRRLRNFKFNPPLKRTQSVVIVVGNVVVGGTGKTPFIVWLATRLHQHGLSVAVISRGYGGQAKQWPIVVTPESDPIWVGDEPVLLAKQLHSLNCAVVVSPKRNQSVEWLESNAPVDVIISDDGLQHFELARDLEIVLVDAQRQFGNGYCLPAGPLREPLTRLNSVDYLVWNGGVPKNPVALNALTRQPPHYTMTLVPSGFRQVQNPSQWLSIADFLARYAEPIKAKNVHAVAGIGNPQRFFESLKSLGIHATCQPFPDHHAYTMDDFKALDDEKPLLMTQKDAVKCQALAHQGQKTHWWYLDVNPQADEALMTALLARILPKTTLKES